jgi:hypothetical protein
MRHRSLSRSLALFLFCPFALARSPPSLFPLPSLPQLFPHRLPLSPAPPPSSHTASRSPPYRHRLSPYPPPTTHTRWWSTTSLSLPPLFSPASSRSLACFSFLNLCLSHVFHRPGLSPPHIDHATGENVRLREGGLYSDTRKKRPPCIHSHLHVLTRRGGGRQKE